VGCLEVATDVKLGETAVANPVMQVYAIHATEPESVFCVARSSPHLRLFMGRSIRTFTVLPHLPARLQALQKLAYNVWWCWNHEAVSLFPPAWTPTCSRRSRNSPVKLLSGIFAGAPLSSCTTTRGS